MSEKKKLNRKIIIIGGVYKEDVYKGVRILWSRKRGDSEKIGFYFSREANTVVWKAYSRQKANLAIITSYETHKKWIRM